LKTLPAATFIGGSRIYKEKGPRTRRRRHRGGGVRGGVWGEGGVWGGDVGFVHEENETGFVM